MLKLVENGTSHFVFRIKDIPSTHKGDGKSIYLTNFLRPSGGVKLKQTLQINFMVDFEWLWMNYDVVKIQVTFGLYYDMVKIQVTAWDPCLVHFTQSHFIILPTSIFSHI